MSDADKIMARENAKNDQFVMSMRERFRRSITKPSVASMIDWMARQGGEYHEIALLARYAMIVLATEIKEKNPT